MIVAARTPRCEAQKNGRHRLDPVDDVLDPVLLVYNPQLAIAAVVPVEARGDQLVESGIRQQIACDLLDGELVEGLVGIE